MKLSDKNAYLQNSVTQNADAVLTSGNQIIMFIQSAITSQLNAAS